MVEAAAKLSWASKLISPGLTSTAVWSADGQRIASGGFDHLVRIWDARTGAQIGKPLSGHRSKITGVAFSLDGRRLVSSSSDGELRLWDVDSDQQIRCMTTAGSVCSPNPDPSDHNPGILSFADSPDGKHLATGDDDGTVQLWDPQTLQPSLPPLKHGDAVFSVAFSPMGPLLASGSRDRTIKLWNVDTGASVGDALLGQSDTITSVAFSPDGHRLASGSHDKSVWIWDGVDTPRPMGAVLTYKNRRSHTAPVSAVAFSPKGGTLMSGSEDGTIRWWDASSGPTYGYSIQLPSTRRGDRVQTVAFDPAPWCDPNETTCTLGVLSCGTAGGIQVWKDIANAVPLEGHNDRVTVVAFDPVNPALIASGSKDHHVMVWEPGSDPPLVHDMQDGAGVGWLAFSPDGLRIVSASWDGKLYIWDEATGKLAEPPIDTHTQAVAAVAYSRDGQRIVSADDDDKAGNWTVQMWDAQTGAPIGPALTGHGPPLQTVAFSPNGALIAAGGTDSTIRLWDAHTGTPKGRLTGHTETVYSLAFSPDGHRLASGGWDGTVRVWDVDDLTQVGKVTGHVGKVRVVTYSPDGRYIVSAGDDGTVRLWDSQTGLAGGVPIMTGSDPVYAVAFSPEGNELVSAGDDEALHIWPFPFNAQNSLCEKIATNMSPEHWKKWISSDPSVGYQIQCPGKPKEPDSPEE